MSEGWKNGRCTLFECPVYGSQHYPRYFGWLRITDAGRTSSFSKGRATYLAISGRTMEFDAKGKCVTGC